MDIFNIFELIGGLTLFLFGMSVMGNGLEASAAGKLQSILARMTTGRFAGLFTGLAVTALIQSSSAVTVMVVGFVNAGLMRLRQATHVIMGANIGTTMTAWLLSTIGITGTTFWMQCLKPSTFAPLLGLIGIICYMFSKRRKSLGSVLLGFTVLMYGMMQMTNAVAGFAEMDTFQQLFIFFENPVLGLLAGCILTAIIQSSSASLGILQALALTGVIPYSTAIPIILGQNIGTCVTAILSSIGTKTNARRASMIHLLFNVVGAVIGLALFLIIRMFINPQIFDTPASAVGIALIHTCFNILSTLILLPAAGYLERAVLKLIPDKEIQTTGATI